MEGPTQLGITRPEVPGTLRNLLFPDPNAQAAASTAQSKVADIMRYQAMLASGEALAPSAIRSPLQPALRYDDPVLGFDPTRADQEDLYARNQSVMGSVANGLGRFATTALTKTGAGLAYVGAGIINAFGDNGGGTFEDKLSSWMTSTADNALSGWINNLEENLKNDWMPIYQEATDRNKGFFMRAATDLNFWTDDFADGAAFMASSLIPGMAISRIGMGARAVRGLSKLGFGKNIAMTEEAAAAFNESLKSVSALKNNYEAISKIPQVAKWVSNAKLARNIDVASQTFLSTASEAMVEAHEVRTKIAQELEGKINPNTGIYYTKDEIDGLAGTAAMQTFQGNVMALAMSNLWEANLIFKRLPSTSGAAGESIKFGEGLLATAEHVKPNWVKQFGKRAATGILAEGLWEENIQLAISRFNEAKYAPTAHNKKYSSSILDTFIKQTGDALAGEDTEASTSIGLGAILGGIVGGVLATKQDRAEDKALQGRITSYNNVASSFKKFGDIWEREEVNIKDDAGNDIKSSRLILDDKGKPIANPKKVQEFIDGNIERAHLLDLMNKATDSGDVSLVNMYENELFAQFAMAHFDMGMADALYEKLENQKNIKDEDLAILGFDPTQREKAVGKITELTQKAKKLQGLYDDIQGNVMDNPKNPILSEQRKKKLFELGARQLFLMDEAKKAETRLNLIPGLESGMDAYNKLVATERSLEQRINGLTAMREAGEIDTAFDESIIKDSVDYLAQVKKEREKIKADNDFSDFSEDADGYLFDPKNTERNAIFDQKRQAGMEELAGIHLALKETTNRFNKLADIRKGERYTGKYMLTAATDIPENYEKVTEAGIDVDNLNNMLRVLVQNVRYDELTEEVPPLAHAEMPLVRRLQLLQAMAEKGNEKAKEILAEFDEQVQKAMALIEKEAKHRRDLEKQKEINEEAGRNEDSNEEDNKDESQDVRDILARKNILDIGSTTVYFPGDKTDHNNFHLRHEAFLSKLSKKSFQIDRNGMKIMLVTRTNQDKLGLPDFITFAPNNTDQEVIAAVHILQEGDERFYIDEDGKKLAKVGEKVDYNKVIYSQLASTETKISQAKTKAGQEQDDRYRNPEKYPEEDIVKWWSAARKAIFENPDTVILDFSVSSGRLNKDLYDNTGKTQSGLISVGLINENELNDDIVTIATFETMVPNGPVATVGSSKVTKGAIYLNKDNHITFLPSRRFTEDEIENMFNMFLHIADELVDGNVSPKEIFTTDPAKLYLDKVLYMKSPASVEEAESGATNITPPTGNQIWIQSGLNFLNPSDPTKFVKIEMSRSAILANEEILKAFLRNTRHQVHNKTLTEQANTKPGPERVFTQPKVTRDGTMTYVNWESYNHYLLLEKNPDGSPRQPVLYVPLKKPGTNQQLITGRYVKPIGTSFTLDLDAINKNKEDAAKKKAAEEAERKRKEAEEAAKKGNKPAAKATGTLTTKQGNTISFSVPVKEKGQKYNEKEVEITEDAGFQAQLDFLKPHAIFKDTLDALKAQVETEDKKNNTKTPEEAIVKRAVKEAITANIIEGLNNGSILLTQPIVEEKKEEAPPPPKTEESVKQDETNNPPTRDNDVDDFLKQFGESDENEPQTRLVLGDVFASRDYQVANIDAEEKWFKDRFPNVEFIRLKQIIKATNGAKAWGMLHNAAVYIYENAEEGTTYHEAFEVVWNMFLTGQEQTELYKEFTKRKGEFRTYKGEVKRFSEASIKEAKEEMAEDFREFILTGKEPQGNTKNIFQKIWDWIKNFFVRSTQDDDFNDNLMDLFKKIEQGSFRDTPILSGYDYNSKEYRYGEVKDAPEAMVQDTLQAMTVSVFSDAFENDADLILAMEEGFEQATEKIYSKLFELMKKEFEVLLPKAYAKEMLKWKGNAAKQKELFDELKAIQTGDGQNGNPYGWKFVQDNWIAFVNDHKTFLKAFNVAFEKNEEGDQVIEITDSDESDNNRNEYTKDDFTLNVKNSASRYIKMLFATLAESEVSDVFKARWETVKDQAKMAETLGKPDSEEVVYRRHMSTLRLPSLVNYGKTFNYVLHNISNSTSIDAIYERLRYMAADPRIQKNANIYRLLFRTKLFTGFANKTAAQVKGMMKLENTLMKQKPTFFRQRYLKNGEVVLYKSNVSTKSKELSKEWLENLKAAPFTKVTTDNMYTFSNIPNISDTSVSGTLAFARNIGITQLTEEAFNSLRTSADNAGTSQSQKAIIDNLNVIRGVLKSAIGQPKSILTGKTVGIQNRYENIAEIMMNQVLAEDNESQHINIDDKPTGNFVLNNWVSYVLNVANESISKSEFIQKMPWFHPKTGDIFSKDSRVVNGRMYNEDGSRHVSLSVSVLEGTSSEESGNRSITKMSLGERMMHEFNSNITGNYNVLMPGDSKTEWAVNMGQLIPLTLYKNKATRAEAKQKYFLDVMRGYLATEIKLAKDFKNRKDIIALTEKDKNGREVGKSLRFFKDILSPETVEKIHAQVVDGKAKLEDVISNEELDKEIDNFLSKQKRGTYSALNKAGYISRTKDKENFILKGFVTDITQQIVGQGRTVSTEALEDLIAYREMSYIIANIEMHKVFFGDPAQFADAEKRIKSFLSGRESTHYSLVEGRSGFNSWANEELNDGLSESDIGYHFFKNHLNHASLKDIYTKSTKETLETLQGVLSKNLLSAYDGKTNEADAASILMGPAYREFLWKAGGRFTEAQEKLFQWHMAYERYIKSLKGQYTYSSTDLQSRDLVTLNISEALNKVKSQNKTAEGKFTQENIQSVNHPLFKKVLVEIKKSKPLYDGNNKLVTFNVLKPIITGTTFEKGIAKTDLIKTSMMPLFYEWVEDTQLVDLYNAAQQKNIDYISFESAHKVGMQKKNTTELYNKEGGINVDGIQKLNISQIPFRNVGIQVENSGTHDSQTQGSQLNKLDLTDLYSDGVPVDYLPDADKNQRFASWNALTSAEQASISEIHRVATSLTEAKQLLTKKRYELLMKKLDIKKVDGKYVLGKDGGRRIADFILSELQRRDLPLNIVEAIETGTLDFETISSYKQIRDIIYSIIEKKILRPKVNGGSHVQIPVTGREKIRRTTVNGKSVLVSDTLKFYSRDSKGKTEACEILLPNKFRGIPLDQIDEEVLKGIGFRIPTQGLNSVEYFKVVGFLPEDMGDVVVFPSEITTKAGSDFDIDKMNMYMRNWYKDGSGRVRALEWKGSEEDTKAYLKEILPYILPKEERARLKEYIKNSNNEAASGLINQMFGSNEEFTDDEIHEFFIEDNEDIPDILDKIYLKTLENNYINALETVVSLPRNFVRLVSPNTQDYMTDGSPGLKALAKMIKDLWTPKGSVDQGLDTQNYSRLLSSSYMTKTRHDFVAGKGGVGISAVSNTNVVVNQVAGVSIPSNHKYKIKGIGSRSLGQVGLEFNKIIKGDGTTHISLGSITDSENGANIANTGSQFIDGYVDIAKGAWIIELGADENSAPDYLFLNKSGVKAEMYSLFMAQPIVRTYLDNVRLDEAKFAAGIIDRRVSRVRRIRDLKTKFKPERMSIKPNLYSKEDMKAMIESVANNIPLTEYQKSLQIHILEDYLTIESARWDLFHAVQGYNYDTQRLNDPNLYTRKKRQTDKARGSSIQGLDSIFAKTFLGTIKDTVDNLNEAFADVYFKLHRGTSKAVLNSIVDEVLTIDRLSTEQYKGLMDRAETTLLNFLIQTTNSIGGKQLNAYTEAILLDKEDGIASWVKRLKESKDPYIMNNEFLQRLIPLIELKKGQPSPVVLADGPTDAITSNNLSSSFMELYNNHTVIEKEGKQKTVSNIMKNLVIAGIIQQGVIKSRTNFVSLIPPHIYNQYVEKVVDRTETLHFFRDADLFYRLNSDSDILVPIVKPVYDEDTDMMRYPTKEGILYVPHFEFADRKFVKTVNYEKIKDENGKMKMDFDNPIVTLYKRINHADGSAFATGIQDPNDENYDPDVEARVYFKPAFKYGIKGIQEMHTTLRSSLFAQNHVPREQSDFMARMALTPSMKDSLIREYTDPFADPASRADALKMQARDQEDDTKTPFDC